VWRMVAPARISAVEGIENRGMWEGCIVDAERNDVDPKSLRSIFRACFDVLPPFCESSIFSETVIMLPIVFKSSTLSPQIDIVENLFLDAMV
jgi:hypothetical protein